MKKRIVVTGATGLIGRQLTHELTARKYDVTICSRTIEKAQYYFPMLTSFVRWGHDNFEEILSAVNQADGVFHLAGETLAQRWTKKSKRRIVESRINGTQLIARAILNSTNPPKFLFSASAIGYYGDGGEKDLDENSQAGFDFPAQVCKEWEKAALSVENVTRVVCGRIGIVLSKHEGALSKLLPAFWCFMGGALGSGNQWWSWVHLTDAANMMIWAMETPEVKGAINICSPNQAQMKNVTNTLSKIINRPAWLNMPAFALKIILGEMSTIALSSQKVMPIKAVEYGFHFQYYDMQTALIDIMK